MNTKEYKTAFDPVVTESLENGWNSFDAFTFSSVESNVCCNGVKQWNKEEESQIYKIKYDNR